MDKFEQHITPNETIKLKRDNGEEDVFTIEPLPYKYLPKMFKLLNKLKDLDKLEGEEVEGFLKIFDDEAIELLQSIELETMKKSYPEEDKNKLKKFVSSNVFMLLEPIIKVNSFGVDSDNMEVKKKAEQLKKLKDKKNKKND